MTAPAAAEGQARACHKCGRPLDVSASFCGYCGTLVVEDEAAEGGEDPYLGRIIDNAFRIEERAGIGAMGVVYRATQLSLDKAVALKILRRTFVRDRVVLQRFRREALAASKLKHPNTINVIHFGECFDGAPYIAMEYLSGRDLGQIVAEDFPLETRRVVAFLVQACLALEEAHGAGIIHRDLKPANIVVSERRGEEFVKVLDFGIAKVADASGEGMSRSADGALTRQDVICGTPAFMSPEQVEGKELDARSDLFSLGIIMYYLLTGRLPFSGETAVDMAASILRDAPRPPSRQRLDARVPPELEALCMRMLDKDPERRCQSAAELRAELEIALQAHLERGGDAAAPATGMVIGAADYAHITVSTDLATVQQAPMRLEDALARPRPGEAPDAATAAARKRRLTLVAAAAVVALLLLALVAAIALSGSADDTASAEATPQPADEPEPDAPGTAQTQPPDPGKETPDDALTTAALVEPRPDAELASVTGDLAAPPAPDGDARTPRDDDDDDETLDGDDEDLDDEALDDEAAGENLSPREQRKAERKARRRQSVRLYKKARSIWRTDTQGAIKLLEEAVDLYGGAYRTWELLGDAYTRVSRRRDAARAYQKVLELEPGHERAMVLRKAIEAGGL